MSKTEYAWVIQRNDGMYVNFMDNDDLTWYEHTWQASMTWSKHQAEKDIRIEELEGQFAYECECNKQLVELQKQLEEKQKTIDEINKEFVQAVHDWKALCAEKDKEISKLQASCQQVKTQLAIQELEKLRNDIWELDIGDYYLQNGGTIENIKVKRKDVCDLIDNQIKELKGE